MTSRTIRSTVAALATGLLVTLGITAAPAAATGARPMHDCPYKYLCVHVYSVWEGTYTWKNWTACTTHDLGTNYLVTWFINDQTPGTRALFTWDDGAPGIPGDWWYTPYPPSKGRPPHHTGAESVTVCA